MTINQQINHGDIQKVCHLHNGIFRHSPVSHFVNFALLPPMRYSPKMKNYGVREKKIFCIYGCFSISRYIKGGRKRHF